MAVFVKLEDSPMFQKQISSLETAADELKDRCQRLYKGSKNFIEALGEACKADNAFADSLEAFGGGHDDPVSVSIGGPVISKFVSAFRELATYKELLFSQVEHVLTDRLTDFMNSALQERKESRLRFDKAMSSYDQARDKFVSLKKNTRGDIVAELEEELENSKSAFEKSRFNLVNALMNIEAKKKYEFLESISSIMDAHLRYFKLGYDLFSQLESYIHQVLTYTQQSKEQAVIEQDKLAKRIQEFRTQSEMDSIRAASNMEPPASSVDGTHAIGMGSYKNMEAIMQSTSNGEVQPIKQGYLLKRSSRLRGDWKRRFFVLDSQGNLYYYRSKSTNLTASHHNYTGSAEQSSGVFGRFRSRHNRSASLNDGDLGCHTIDLHTSTIKMDAEYTDLRLCFRIISPQKSYTLQAENGADRMDWINKITGVIASLLNYHLQQPYSGAAHLKKSDSSRGASSDASLLGKHKSKNNIRDNTSSSVCTVLREIPGNNICAECSAPDPEWASLNLGILLCIECSGVHRNLGVHISKVRSLTLDVRVWEPTILELFHTLGNTYCNSVWEGQLLHQDERVDSSTVMDLSISKPCSKDSIHLREKYIHAKYVQKALVIKDTNESESLSHVADIWEAVKTQNLQEVYRLIVTSGINIAHTTFDKGVNVDSDEPGISLQGCSLLHLACHYGNPVMVELLIQFGADLNMIDLHGRTPLHCCIASGNNKLAKLLLRRGARPSIKDGRGLSALERAMEMGAITDEELFILLSESE